MLIPTYPGFFDVETRTAKLTAMGDPLVELNARIKADKPPEDWPENKKRQKDADAHWTKKNNDTHYDYNNHINADEANKLVQDYTVRIPGKFRKLQIMMIEVTEKYVITKFKKTFLINAQYWMNDLLPTSVASIRVTLVKVAYLYLGQP